MAKKMSSLVRKILSEVGRNEMLSGGEPAISRFDWPFTPSHKSSANFSTLVGSVLQLVLPTFNLPMARSPGFGSIPCNLTPS